MEWFALGLAALFGAAFAGVTTVRAERRRRGERLSFARAEATAVVRAAELDATAALRAAETEAREQGLEVRAAAERDRSARLESLDRREERVAKRGQQVEQSAGRNTERQTALSDRDRSLQSKGDRAKNANQEAARLGGELRTTLERVAGATAAELSSQLIDGWVEEARAEAAQRVRLVEQGSADPEYGREAKRIMGIAVGRYQGHYLTERLISNVPVPPGFPELLQAGDSRLLLAIEQGAGVKLEIHESGEKVRIDSGDGLAREIARRAFGKLIKGTAPKGVEKDPAKWVEQLKANLDREVVDLGRRAFAELEIPRAHPEIVKLVGRLNWRTSYTQNQWKHALEASFLAGMMADELGLDVKLARRATLMHDIGKALTHEIEGSHAVIGADYARRLGEAEIVANAIGAHHAEEPPNSIYAYLVAAADAMSGARPGARREQTEQFSTRVEDLQRIGQSFRGVDRAFAVQGGREIRIYVHEKNVSDLRAVELVGEIAKKISDELVFPGQIKVTIIRQVEAVATAN